MTREEALEELEKALGMGEEDGHGLGDDVLCELLTTLGFADVVKAYNKIEKWYA